MVRRSGFWLPQKLFDLRFQTFVGVSQQLLPTCSSQEAASHPPAWHSAVSQI
jgi:hypothetical protein